MTNLQKWSGLMGWLALCFAAGLFGSYFDPGSWYEALNKPSWTPPNWVFPVVWPILYAMMGIAAWLVWRDYGFKDASSQLRWFLLQLGLNAAWSWIFFGRQSISMGLAEILLLWIAIFFTIILFWDKRKSAAWLMIPYLLWITYASALNFSIWQLN